MPAKVIKFPDQMKDITTWDWQDFKIVWEQFAKVQGEDAAWQMIYQLWQVRAGENK